MAAEFAKELVLDAPRERTLPRTAEEKRLAQHPIHCTSVKAGLELNIKISQNLWMFFFFEKIK